MSAMLQHLQDKLSCLHFYYYNLTMTVVMHAGLIKISNNFCNPRPEMTVCKEIPLLVFHES